jgi:hypothetical protein
MMSRMMEGGGGLNGLGGMMGGGGIPGGFGGGDVMDMLGGAGAGELMGMAPQLMRMANVGGGRHGRRHRRR